MAGFLETDQDPVPIEALKSGFVGDVETSGGALAEHSSASLVEMIANLYHQENAYQASLKASNRMLALV
jgi:hypothetical protein